MTPKPSSKTSSPKSDSLPKVRSVTIQRKDGLWHLVILTSQGDTIIDREINVGDAKQIQLMKAWLAVAKEARAT